MRLREGSVLKLKDSRFNNGYFYFKSTKGVLRKKWTKNSSVKVIENYKKMNLLKIEVSLMKEKEVLFFKIDRQNIKILKNNFKIKLF